MTTRPLGIPLSIAKATLSELVRSVNKSGKEVIITLDGEPAARLVAVAQPANRLTASEVATVRVLMAGLARIPRPSDAFDAVSVVAEGRR